MRRLAGVTALAVAVTLIGTNYSWAGSAGRKNTAIAATALAVGAWSNGTGKAGRRNTAILATTGAAFAWSRYQSKKRQEHRPRASAHEERAWLARLLPSAERDISRQVIEVVADLRQERGPGVGALREQVRPHRPASPRNSERGARFADRSPAPDRPVSPDPAPGGEGAPACSPIPHLPR